MVDEGEAGGKSGLQSWGLKRASHEGNAPGNTRGQRLGVIQFRCAATESATEKRPPVCLHFGGRLSEKPEACLVRSSAFGKGEKVG